MLFLELGFLAFNIRQPLDKSITSVEQTYDFNIHTLQMTTTLNNAHVKYNKMDLIDFQNKTILPTILTINPTTQN
jgi:hypothetical protein